MWHWILAALASVAAGPDALEREAPKSAAAVAVAYGSLARPVDRQDVGGDASRVVSPSDDRQQRNSGTHDARGTSLPAGVAPSGK